MSKKYYVLASQWVVYTVGRKGRRLMKNKPIDMPIQVMLESLVAMDHAQRLAVSGMTPSVQDDDVEIGHVDDEFLGGGHTFDDS